MSSVVRKQDVTDTAGKHKEEKTMSLRSAFEYHMAQTIRPIRNYYIVIVVLTLLFALLGLYFEQSERGTPSVTLAIVFFLGILSFGNVLKMFLQNGISRKTLYYSMLLRVGVVACGMTVIDTLIAWVNERSAFIGGKFFASMYGSAFSNDQTILSFVVGCFWYALLYALVMMFASFFGVALYRVSRAIRMSIYFGVPMLFFIVLPILDSFNDFGVFIKMQDGILWLGGLSDLLDPNPYHAMGSFFVGFLLCAGLLYFVVRHVVVREE